jgi:hypothetical protein
VLLAVAPVRLSDPEAIDRHNADGLGPGHSYVAKGLAENDRAESRKGSS